MLSQGVVGQTGQQADGAQPSVRLGRLSDAIVSQLHGRYYEGTSRQAVFTAMLAATTGTIAAGNINAAAAAASTQFALWNPANSGVNLSLLKVLIGAISGTPAGGPAFHSFASGVPNSAVATGSGLSNLLGASKSKALYLASAAGAALTGMNNPLTTFRPMNVTYFAAALAAGANVDWSLDEVDGDIVIPPNTLWVPTWSGAGTTFLNAYGVTWEEVPI